MEITKEKNGITLIALIITIIVLLILAGITISTIVGNNGILKKAIKSKVYTELSEIREKLTTNIDYSDFLNESNYYMNTDEANQYISNEEYQYKFGIYRGKVHYLTEKLESETAQYAKELDIEPINMSPDEFKYYIELGILQDKVKSSNPVGRELYTSEFEGSITINDSEYGNLTYTNGWYLVGNYSEEEKTNGTFNSDYEKLGLKDTTHAPYIVNYDTGVVLSINGMKMPKYKSDKEYEEDKIVHSFDNILTMSNAIVYVDESTVKNGNRYGQLYSTSKYNGKRYYSEYSWYTEPHYDDNNGDLEYDENGVLVLDNDNAIPVLDINQKYKIGNEYTVSITVEGDINQFGTTGLAERGTPITLCAISNDVQNICTWIGIYKGYLHVYSYYNTNPIWDKDSVSVMETDGFCSIKIPEKYQNKIMNIQVSAVRGGESNIYINGEKIATYNSGNAELGYDYLTIGDLRVGRGLKYEGKVHDFAIFGISLTDNQIKENYQRTKAYKVYNE